MEEIMKSVEFWQITSAAITVVVGLVLLIPKMQKCILCPIFLWIKTLLLMPQLVRDIRGQVFNNGGSSLKDSVDRIAGRLDVVEGRMLIHSITNADPKWWSDEKGKTVAINNAFSRLLKCSIADAKDFNFIQFIPGDAMDEVMAGWLRTVELGAEYNKHMELVDIYRNPLGLYEVHSIPIKTANGKIHSYEGTLKAIDPVCPYSAPCQKES